MRIMIVGGGIAALSAAEAARKTDAAAEIALFSAEPYPPYRRMALGRFLALEAMVHESAMPEELKLRPDEFYDAQKITLHLATPIVSLNCREHRLTAADNMHYAYDRLVLATGGRAVFPPISGCQPGGRIMALRNYDDLLLLRSHFGAGWRRIGILGGGVLGLELADALRHCGAEITIFEQAESLLPRQLDRVTATDFQAEIANEPRIVLQLGANLTRIVEQPDTVMITGAPDLHWTVDLLLLAAGMRPCCELAAGAGLPAHRGFIVQRDLHCGDPDIFCAGDCAEWDGTIPGIWPAAVHQGEIAGANAASPGREKACDLRCHREPVRLAAFGRRFYCQGKVDDETLDAREGTTARGGRIRLFGKSNRLVGGIAIDDWPSGRELDRLLESGMTYDAACEIFGLRPF